MESIKTRIINNLLARVHENLFSRKEIIQAILDTRNKEEIYSYKKHRGLYSSALTNSRGMFGFNNCNGYLLRPGKEKRYFKIVSKGIYTIVD